MTVTTIPDVQESEADSIPRRVSILRQLKKNLLGQRERLVTYLDILEHEKDDIERGDLERLTAHVDMEQAVIQEIRTFTRVIDPLDKLYRAAYPEREGEIPALRSSLSDLTDNILRRNRANRELLRKEMARIETELSLLRIPARKKELFNLQEASTLIDIST